MSGGSNGRNRACRRIVGAMRMQDQSGELVPSDRPKDDAGAQGPRWRQRSMPSSRGVEPPERPPSQCRSLDGSTEDPWGGLAVHLVIGKLALIRGSHAPEAIERELRLCGRGHGERWVRDGAAVKRTCLLLQAYFERLRHPDAVCVRAEVHQDVVIRPVIVWRHGEQYVIDVIFGSVRPASAEAFTFMLAEHMVAGVRDLGEALVGVRACCLPIPEWSVLLGWDCAFHQVGLGWTWFPTPRWS